MKPSEIRWFKDKHELSVTNGKTLYFENFQKLKVRAKNCFLYSLSLIFESLEYLTTGNNQVQRDCEGTLAKIMLCNDE